MRRPVALPLYVLVVVTMLLSLVPPVTMAQSECPPPLVKDPVQDICLDPETGLYVPPEDYPTEVPTEVPPEPPAPPAGNLASFTLYHLTCDSDFDPNGVRDGGGLGSANGCLTFGKPPFTYTISANGIPITTATLDATERDFARFDVPGPIPAGTLTISVAPVTDYTTEFISCGLEIGEAGTDVIEPPIAGGTATLSTLPDQKVECWVYNVNRQPEDQNQNQNPGEDVVTGDGNNVGNVPVDESGTVDIPVMTTITIAAYLCPAGVTAADDLIAACTQRASGIAFSLLTANETLETQVSDAEGDIFYSGVPANDYGISAALPAGYGEPIVFCYVADPIGNVFEGQEDVVFGNQIRLRLGDKFSAECAWYNVPATGPDNGPNVFIQARLCGEDVEITPSMTVFEAEALCGVVYQNEEFQVQINDQVIATTRTGDGPLSSGQAFFTKLPAPGGGGIYGIEATLREGDQVLGVFCDQNYGGDRFVTVTTMLADGNRIDQELLEGWTLRCSWFFWLNPLLIGTQVADQPPAEVPAADEAPQPGITVQARLCPPEVVEQQLDLAAACTEPGTGITFDVAIGGEPSSTQTTGESGDVAVPIGVGTATYLVNNQPNPGLSEPEVFCTITHADGTVERVGGFVTAGSPGQEIAFDGASEVVCIFFFLGEVEAGELPQEGAPPEDGVEEGENDEEAGEEGDAAAGPHTLTIQFWACPEGIDPAADQVDLVQSCSTDTVERSFMLTVDGVATGQTVTGSVT